MAGSQRGVDSELLRALTSGDAARLEELLTRQGDGTYGHSRTDGRVAISVQLADAAATTGAAAPPPSPPRRHGDGPSGLLLGVVTSGGSTALHVLAGRGHAGLAGRVCELAPSLAAARDGCLDTPLHRAAKAGHREAAACLLAAMRAGGGAEAGAALRARNRLGATALYEAVRNGHAATVDLLTTEAPDLAAVTTGDGVSPLYLAALTGSAEMVRALLRPSPDGTPSPASSAGPEGRTALHAAAAKSKEIVQEILGWYQGPPLLSKADSSGKIPLHYAISHRQHGVVLLLLNAEASLARVSDNEGLFPVHVAAMMGDIGAIAELVERCPDFAELVDGNGRNFLHCAIEHGQENVVRFICRNGRFAILLNAMDYEGNTPLHLAVKHGHPRMVSSLLQNMTVEVGITNRDGLTAADLAYSHLEPGLHYFLNPRAVVKNCLYWTRAPLTLGVGEGDHVHLHNRMSNTPATDEDPKDIDGITATSTIASVLIATVTFAAAFTVPGGYVADDRPRAAAGTAVLARRLAFRAFVASDAMAFLCSIAATCLLVHGGAGQVPPRQRRLYQRSAAGLLPPGAQLMVSAFAFGVHAVLGEANRWLVTVVYALALAAVLLCFPGIWAPFYLGRAIWRRAGWRGLANVHRRPESFEELFWLFITSFLFKIVTRPLFAVLISVAFVASIALNIALPNY